MEEKLNQWMSIAPMWVWLLATAVLGLGFGFFVARNIWGKNKKRLRATLDDSAYLAGQWATMGLSQSHLVEKLGQKVSHSLNEFAAKESTLRNEIRNQQKLVAESRATIKDLQENGTQISKREVETLQLQVAEVGKRDERIKTLEARLKYLDTQGEQTIEEHQKQVKVLLERIAVLEERSEAAANTELVENNRQLTELLKQRCTELEILRDEFYAKQKDLVYLKEQNSILKKNVDEIVANWSKKKGSDAELGKTKIRLNEAESELKHLRSEFENQSLELELLKSKHLLDPPAAETVEEVESAGAQIDILLEIIENRDLRVTELERQIGSGTGGDQILALTQTIADLQTRLTRNEQGLEASSRVANLPEPNQPTTGDNRILTEAKSISRDRQTLKNPGCKEIFYFSENSSQINEDDASVLDALISEILNTGCQVSVYGFAAKEGDNDTIQTLSNRRAEAVRDRFAQNGVKPSQVIIKGRGLDNNLTNADDKWKARRVEVVLLPVAEIVN